MRDSDQPIRASGAILAMLLGISAWLAPAVGAARGDVARLRAPMSQDGLLGIASTDPIPPAHLHAAATLGFANNPVVWRYDDGTYEPLVASQLTLDMMVNLGIVRFVDIAFGVPVTLNRADSQSPELGNLSGSTLGDLRLLTRLQIADERSFGYGGAIVSEISFPTGNSQLFAGEEAVTWHPQIVGSVPVATTHLIASLGYRLRKNSRIADLEFNDDLTFHVGSTIPLSHDAYAVTGIVEFSGSTSASNAFSQQSTAIESLLGARVHATRDISITGAIGVGLTQAIGTPAMRLLLGASWSQHANDIDYDGVLDSDDTCPYEPEDFDGVDDDDGCPEWDSDGDGINDDVDDCPSEAEDFNSYLDDDGCPDAAELDSDNDGIADFDDPCPQQPEDVDGFEDDDGCPDIDNDYDGIADAFDRCPESKETINGIDDYDGCPDEGEGLTDVVETKIAIQQTILFESGRAILDSSSLPVLDQVALQILAHPRIEHITIEGHTDSLGAAEDNRYLSQDRADSVKRYLVKRGVAKDMLEAIGYGEERPIDSNETRAGRSANRRVEFIIRHSGDSPVD